MLQELLAERARVGDAGPSPLRRAIGTRGFAREVQAVLARAREKGLGPDELRAARRRADGVPELRGRRRVPRAVPRRPRQRQAPSTTPTWSRRAGAAEADRPAASDLRGPASRTCSSTSTRTPTPARCALLRALAGDGRDLIVVGDPRPVDLRLPRRRRARHPRLPGAVPARRRARPADVVALRTTRRFGATAAAAPRSGSPPGSPLPGSIDARRRTQAFLDPQAAPTGSATAGSRCCTFDTDAGRGRAPRRPAAPRPPRGRRRRGPRWRCWSAPGAASIPALRRALGAAGVPVEVASDDIPLVREPAVLPLLDALRAVVNLDNDDRRPPTTSTPPGPRRCWSRRSAASTPPTYARAGPAAARPREGARRRPRTAAAAVGRAAPRRAARRADGYARRACHGRRRPSAARGPGRAAARGPRARSTPARTAEEVLWVLWAGTDWPRRLRRAVDAGGAARPAGAPRPRRDLRALRDRRPRRGAARPHQRRELPRHAWSPSRSPPTRSPSGGPRRRRPAADRPPVQGPGVAARRGRPRAGGRLARPAPPLHAAAGRPDRSPTACCRRLDHARRCSPRSAGCSTSPAPGPASGCSSPPSRRPTTTASSRPGSSTSSASSRRDARPGPAAAPAVAGRPGRRAAPHRRRPRQPRRRCAQAAAAPARPAGARDRGRRPPAGARRPTRPTWWGTRARDAVRRAGARRRRAGAALRERAGRRC